MPISLIVPRNPLAYPNGARAGLNSNHIALSRGSACRFAAVARNGNFIDLTRGGAAGAITGAPTRAIDGHIGDSVQQSTTSAGYTFAGRATTDPRITFAAIVKWANVAAGSFSFIFANSTSTSGYNGFFAGSDGSIELRWGSFNYTSGAAAMSNNIPYFVAGSVEPFTNINFVVKRLDTGATTSFVVGPTTGSYIDAPNGNYMVGNWGGFSLGAVGRIAAVAYLNSYLTIPQLRQWAQAPWDFWYPPTLGNVILAKVAAAAPPTARQYAVTVNAS